MTLPITLVTEDELSEAIARRILTGFPTLLIGSSVRRNGNGYIRSRIRNFCAIAHHSPLLVVTDLDLNKCQASLLSDWLRRLPRPPGLLLRVAVREIESWLLADHDAVTALIGKPGARRLPDHPDEVADPKTLLLELAKQAPKDIRADLRAESGAIARQGLGYNARLCDLVGSLWQPERAAVRSPSLRRSIVRIRELSIKDEL